MQDAVLPLGKETLNHPREELPDTEGGIPEDAGGNAGKCGKNPEKQYCIAGAFLL